MYVNINIYLKLIRWNKLKLDLYVTSIHTNFYKMYRYMTYIVHELW